MIAIEPKFTEFIQGKGFTARVEFHGRATIEEEDGEAWIFGVNPGGVAASGVDMANCSEAFRKACISVLEDIADEGKPFEAFKAEVERFFHETNVPTEREWIAAQLPEVSTLVPSITVTAVRLITGD